MVKCRTSCADKGVREVVHDAISTVFVFVVLLWRESVLFDKIGFADTEAAIVDEELRFLTPCL